MQILIADDDPLVRAVIERVIVQANHDLIEAEDGAVALRLIENGDPDMLITDLHMPVLDGFGLVHAVRASARHRAMPIVCLSAVNDLDALMRLAELGITDYVLKPIRPRDLADRLRAVIAANFNWKAARDAPMNTGAPGILVVDPNGQFRSVVTTALGDDFTVVEAPTAAAAVMAFRARTPGTRVVLISEGLQLLDEERLAALFRRIAGEAGAPPPLVILVSAADAVTPEKAAGFDAVVTRSLTANEFLATIAPWLDKAAAAEALSPAAPPAAGEAAQT